MKNHHAKCESIPCESEASIISSYEITPHRITSYGPTPIKKLNLKFKYD